METERARGDELLKQLDAKDIDNFRCEAALKNVSAQVVARDGKLATLQKCAEVQDAEVVDLKSEIMKCKRELGERTAERDEAATQLVEYKAEMQTKLAHCEDELGSLSKSIPKQAVPEITNLFSIELFYLLFTQKLISGVDRFGKQRLSFATANAGFLTWMSPPDKAQKSIQEAENRGAESVSEQRKTECREINDKIAGLELQLQNSSAVALGHKIAITRIIRHVKSTNRQYLRIRHNGTIAPHSGAGPAQYRLALP